MTPIYKSPVARSIPFDNSTNGYTATELQSAVEEGVATAISKPRFSIVTVFNGRVSNNQWLGYSNLVPGDAVPLVIPVHCILREISFSFKNSNVDGRFDLYVNGITAGNIVYSITFTNENVYKLSTGINYSLNQGDQIRGRWVDLGDNPSDMVITYFPQAD